MPFTRVGKAGSKDVERLLRICYITTAKGNVVEPKKGDKLADLLWSKPEPEPSSARWHEL